MSTTTRRWRTSTRRRHVVGAERSNRVDPSPAPLQDAPAGAPEVLIKEARRHQRRRWAVIVLVIVAVAGLVAGLLASIPPSGPTRSRSHEGRAPSASPPPSLEHLAASAPPPSRCSTGTATTRGATVPVTQSLDGAFSGCLRVGSVRSGSYHVVVEATLTTSRPDRVEHEPRIRLSISPRSGRPGSRVTVTGVVSVAHELATAPRPNGTSTTTICWGECPGGLSDTVDTVHWSSPTTFHVSFKVPDAPWVEAGPSGTPRVVRLASGTYRIGLRCVGPFAYNGCGLGPAESSVRFRIVVPAHAHVARCPIPTACALLALTRRSAIPAQMVRVRGFAPLVSMIGTRPNGEALDVLPGRAKGPQITVGRGSPPRVSLSYGWVRMGDASLAVKAPPTFASLGRFSVLSETGDGLAPISANPGAPDRVAYCAPGAVVITTLGAGGAVTNTSIPTVGAVAALARAGMSPVPAFTPAGEPSSCDTLALPKSGPAIFLAFEVPVVPTGTVDRDVGLETSDGGASWSVLPTPPGATVTGFGGFRYQSNAVEALYSPASLSETVETPRVEQFDPASGTWYPTALECPSSGPCVTLGPFSASNCAAGVHAQQELLRSSDGGASWEEPAWPTLLDPCAHGEIAAVSESTELLVHGSLRLPYLVLRSTDGGATWTDVGLPRTPFASTTGPATGQLTLLSNGALLARAHGADATWELLVPGSQRWCTVRSVPAAMRSSARDAEVSVFGRQLWWVNAGRVAPSSVLDHVEIAAIGC